MPELMLRHRLSLALTPPVCSLELACTFVFLGLVSRMRSTWQISKTSRRLHDVQCVACGSHDFTCLCGAQAISTLIGSRKTEGEEKKHRRYPFSSSPSLVG